MLILSQHERQGGCGNHRSGGGDACGQQHDLAAATVLLPCPERTGSFVPAPFQLHTDATPPMAAPPFPPSVTSRHNYVDRKQREEEGKVAETQRRLTCCGGTGTALQLALSLYLALSRHGEALSLGLEQVHPRDALDAYIKNRKEVNDRDFLCGAFRVQVREGGHALYAQQFCPGERLSFNRLEGLRCFLSKARVAPDVDFLFWYHDGPPSMNHAPDWGHVPLVSPEGNFPFVMSQSITTPSRFSIEPLRNPRTLLSDAKLGLEHPFEQKKRQAVWRGTTTGGVYTVDTWKYLYRTRLVFFSLQHPNLLDAGFSGFVQITEEAKQEMEAFRIDQGDGEEGRLLAAPISMEQQCSTYRAVVVVDGNSSPDWLAWQLACGTSVVLWQIPKNPGDEWFSELCPWVHFIPLHPDLSNLEERLLLVLDESLETMAWMKAVARAGGDFIIYHLSTSMIKCYWLEFLSSLASITPLSRFVESNKHTDEGWERLDLNC